MDHDIQQNLLLNNDSLPLQVINSKHKIHFDYIKSLYIYLMRIISYLNTLFLIRNDIIKNDLLTAHLSLKRVSTDSYGPFQTELLQ